MFFLLDISAAVLGRKHMPLSASIIAQCGQRFIARMIECSYYFPIAAGKATAHIVSIESISFVVGYALFDFPIVDVPAITLAGSERLSGATLHNSTKMAFVQHSRI
jgi:hypothetical protein